jgi:hypothetical protein
MHSYVSPDPIGIFLAYLPVALAAFACLLAISVSTLSLAANALARRYGREAPVLPEAAPEPA